MKKILIICVGTWVWCSTTLSAQKIYVNLGAGYGLPLAPQLVGAKYNSGSVKAVNKSYGMGIMPAMGVGVYFREKTVALQLDFQYLKCDEVEVFDNVSTGGPHSTYTGSMIRISPSCKLMTGGKTKLYTRFGAVMGLSAHLT